MSEQSERRSPGLTALGEGLLIAYEAIRANKIRAGLTILGVAVGVSVVVAMAALITGLKTSVSEAFESAGPNNFSVTRFDFTAARNSDEGNNRPPWWNKPKLDPREADRIAALPGIAAALYNFNFNVDFDFEGQRVRNVTSLGYSSGWGRYDPGDFIAGRDFTPAEVRQNRALVVITDALAEELFGQRDPIGKRVRVGNVFRGTQEPFTVVGVYRREANIFSSLQKHVAFFPYTSAIRRLRQSDWLSTIQVAPEDSVSMLDAQDEVIAALRGMRGLGPRDENNFALLASAQILEIINQFTAVIFLVMLALSSAGLLVGGVGVIGIMLISVTERTREIGIRKAVGATRREILWQFLVEASVLTALGAAAGMLLGWGLASVVTALTPLPARIPLWAVGTALAMAALTGMLFGLLPAYRASRLDPVDALRYE